MTKRLPLHDASLGELRTFAQIELLAVDIDGTLLSSTRGAPMDVLRTQVNRLKAQRVHTIIATGRALSGARPFIEGLGLRREPTILYNGAVVTPGLDQPPIACDYIDASAISVLIEVCEREGCALWTYHWGLMDVSEHVSGWGKHAYAPVELNGLPIRPVREHEGARDDIVAALVQQSDTGDFLGQALESLTQAGLVSTTTSGTGYWEVRPALTSKARGLEIVCDRLAVELHNTAAIGDNLNDIEILSSAGVGIAVSNATDATQQAADFVTQMPSTQGVYELFHLVLEARRYHRGGVLPVD